MGGNEWLLQLPPETVSNRTLYLIKALSSVFPQASKCLRGQCNSPAAEPCSDINGFTDNIIALKTRRSEIAGNYRPYMYAGI